MGRSPFLSFLNLHAVAGVRFLQHSLFLFAPETGAYERDRTADLVLTKDVLCQLSYVGPLALQNPAA